MTHKTSEPEAPQHTKLQTRIYHLLEDHSNHGPAARIINAFLLILILLNVIASILHTVQTPERQYSHLFYVFEIFSVTLFTAEYLLRAWVCTEDSRYRGPVLGRLRHGITLLALVDLFAILPFFLPMLFAVDLRFLRILRLLRVFRVLKLVRYSESIGLIGRVLKNRGEELLVTGLVSFILLVLSSSLVFLAEHTAQPDKFPDIPATMWWGCVTMTTVGYGDVFPITPIGKTLAMIITILGIGLFALPTAIIGSGFIEEIQKRHKQEKVCPHCGKTIDE